jgi:DNA-binding MarR family transcriptional regulator
MDCLKDQVEKTGPTKYLCFRVGKSLRKMLRYYDASLSRHNITPTQLFVFAALAEEDGQKFKELASRVNMEGSTLTGVLDRMERAGFVERREDPEDRRSLLIFFSDKAREILPEVIATADEVDKSIINQIPADEFQVFLRVVGQIGDNDWGLH